MKYYPELVDEIAFKRDITVEQLCVFLDVETNPDVSYLHEKARGTTKRVYGNGIYIRGLIELTNYCKNNCYYCGIRCENREIQRYRLTKDQVMQCCEEGHRLGFRTFVLQGGEDPYFTDEKICEIVRDIRRQYPDCAITLSLGEKEKESYQRYYDAGANRYLLRHETADETHYRKLHPPQMDFHHRIRCLRDLKQIGYQTGCGMMVGSPGQTVRTIWNDLQFILELQPQMVGIGPFIPQHATPFAKETSGSLEWTLRLLSIIRLLHPSVLLPSTTALGTIHPKGRELGILSGGNVVMPNLSPRDVRDKYLLYDHKANTGEEAAEGLERLRERMQVIGYEILIDRGDFKGQIQEER